MSRGKPCQFDLFDPQKDFKNGYDRGKWRGEGIIRKSIFMQNRLLKLQNAAVHEFIASKSLKSGSSDKFGQIPLNLLRKNLKL